MNRTERDRKAFTVLTGIPAVSLDADGRTQTTTACACCQILRRVMPERKLCEQLHKKAAENAFLSRTIEVQENQTVVDTGLYGIVRHPMYAATLALFLSMPLVLGSLWAFLVFLAYPFIIAGRIRGEEKLLRAELAGYEEYCRKVKWRVIPFVW